MESKEINIVWFKRDLRLRDHEPLERAQKEGLPVLLMYCFEPSIMNYEDSDERHWRFVYESLKDMQERLESLNAGIYIFHSEALPVFEKLVQNFTVKTVFSYQETGNKITYDRDLQMVNFFRNNQIQWKESQTNGVIRRRKSTVSWEVKWQEVMNNPQHLVELDKLNTVALNETVYQSIKGGLLPESIVNRNVNFQQGGEHWAWRYLHSFLSDRYVNYSNHISKPSLSRKGCSRLSPYLSYGNLSIRQVYQEAVNLYFRVRDKRPLANFVSRLQWHCHFIQKFEDECRMEFENVNRSYDQISKPRNEVYIKAWQEGRTGVPMVDASIHCLIQTGYLNFRMRAMVVSFFVYNLWQDWRDLHFLARVFLDYEPGIHYPQLQMQSGTTGINTIRIYNPVRNSELHDSDGVFIKKWIPALKEVPTPLLHEPWKMTSLEQEMYRCKIGVDYPAPLVDLDDSRKRASDIMWQFRNTLGVKKENERILRKHVRATSSKESKQQKDQLEDEE